MVRCLAFINPSSVAAGMFFGFACEIVGVQPTKKNSARRFASRTALPQGKPKLAQTVGATIGRPQPYRSIKAFPSGGRRGRKRIAFPMSFPAGNITRQRWMRCHAQSNGASRRRALQDCAKRAQTVMRGLAPAAPCASNQAVLPLTPRAEHSGCCARGCRPPPRETSRSW